LLLDMLLVALSFLLCFLANAGMESDVAMASAAIRVKNFFIGCATSIENTYATSLSHAQFQTLTKTKISTYPM
jgi:hypothetical protein